MMKTVFGAAVALCVLASCAEMKVGIGHDGPLVKQRRNVTGFERVELLGSLDVKYQQADSFSVWVEAPEKTINDVETRLDGQRLVVGMKGSGRIVSFGYSSSSQGATVYVTSPDLLGMELRGSGDFECKSAVDTDNLDIRLKGSGDIEFHDIICDRISTSLVGSGDIEVKQVTALQSDIELVGSGDLKMGQRKVQQSRVTLKGSGDVALTLDDCGTMDCQLTGSGDISLKGTVDRLNKQTRGSGDIHTRSLTIRN